MQSKIFLLLLQYVLFSNKYDFTNAIFGSKAIRTIREGEYSSVACLILKRPELSIEYNTFCTATFISNTHLLTTEHCLELSGNYGFVVNAGSRDIRIGHNYFPIWWLTYKRYLEIYQKTPKHAFNDIGIIRLGEPVDGIIPARISKISPPKQLYGEMVNAVGCGLTNEGSSPVIKETASLTIIPNSECSHRATKAAGRFVEMQPHYLCTRNKPQTLLALSDFGGPLFLNGEIVALSVGLLPVEGRLDDLKKCNHHITIDDYRRFIKSNLAM